MKPYGHHLEDGIVQVCFTLPVEPSPQAQKAATAYAEKMGLRDCRVVWMEAIGSQFTYFIIYGSATYTLDWNQVLMSEKAPSSLAERTEDIDLQFRQQLGRRITLLACTSESSERAVEFEALLSMQGVVGEVGLEGYSTFQVQRYREIKGVDDLIAKAVEIKADALLVYEPAEGQKALGSLARKLKGCKELPPWFLRLTWEPGTLPTQTARMVVEGLCQRGINTASADEKIAKDLSPKKRGLFGWLRG